MVLVFLGALCREFLNARPNVIGNFTVKSLENTYHLCEVITQSHRIQQAWNLRIILSLQSKVKQQEVEAVGEVTMVVIQVDKLERESIVIIVKSEAAQNTTAHYCKKKQQQQPFQFTYVAAAQEDHLIAGSVKSRCRSRCYSSFRYHLLHLPQPLTQTGNLTTFLNLVFLLDYRCKSF